MERPELNDTVIEFLAELALDHAAGRERPLVDYLARFPGSDAQLAAAYSQWLGVGAPALSPAENDPERPLLGPYQLVRELGRGGQAVVWLAEDTRVGRRVALKVTARPPSAADLAPRMRREALAAARVDHPGLCPIFDVGADESQAWIAMRYVEGETLERQLARDPRTPLEQRLRWLEAVARALHSAHEAGVVHRDVKPGNVMVQPDGQPVVLDFGIARADDGGARLTLTGEALGTPAYMAPEQLRGDAVDRRADVWSLGVTAFEVVVGRRPFDAPTRESLIRSILEDNAPDARALDPRAPRDLAIVLATALEKDVERRYQTCLDLAEELRRVRAREPIVARPAGAALKLRRWAQRNQRLAASLALLAFVLVAALATTTWLLRQTRDALSRRDALVRDVGQLSDQTLASDLLDERDALWPATEETAPRIEAWLVRARELLARRPMHAAARDLLARRVDLDPDPERNRAAREWLVSQLDRLLESLGQLEGATTVLEARAQSAATLRARSVELHAEAWRAAAARIAADPRFAGRSLAPQIGLVPLGPDPRSGLEEFAHLSSGRTPPRAASGELAIDGETAIVLVLVPPGAFDLGSELPSDARPAGSPNSDPWSGRWDGPVRRVALDPYFIGKFELTRGQYRRHVGDDPSSLDPQDAASGADVDRVPVETISWHAARRVLFELDLELPTEAQWEHAARGGTTGVFFTGDDFASLQGYANVADAAAARSGSNWPCALELDDGFVALAPVGSFAANAFGVHDVHGNVMEWCRDTWEDLANAEPRAGDGLFVGSEPTHVQRGGSFSHNPAACRSASRHGARPEYVAPVWGVRAARRVD